jgi:hypothetical protein
MKSYLMKNPSNGEDINNCTILSLSLAASIPYEKADEIGIKAGREKNKGFHLEPLYEEARKKGIRINKIPVSPRMNLKQFISDFPLGRFVLEKKEHAFCVINGIVHDVIKNELNCKIECAYHFDVDGASKVKEYFRDNYFC